MPEGWLTIQNSIKSVFEKIQLENHKMESCSRTDASVNAFHHPVTIDLAKDGVTLQKVTKLQISINNHFHKREDEISVSHLYFVPRSFSVSREVTMKSYVYNIRSNLQDDEYNCIHKYDRVWSIKEHIPKEKLEYQLNKYIGEHDWYNFTTRTESKDAQFLTFTRTVSRINVILVEDEESGVQDYKIVFFGRKFVRYQIRYMVGYVIGCLTGKYTEAEFESLLVKHENLAKFKRTPAPGKGLFLKKVSYDQEKTMKFWLDSQKFLVLGKKYLDYTESEGDGYDDDYKSEMENFKRMYLKEECPQDSNIPDTKSKNDSGPEDE